MFFLLIFPVLVAGFLACHIRPIRSYKLHRYEGQYLYLKSAELGLKCFIVAFIISLAAHYWMPATLSFCRLQLNLDLSTALSMGLIELGAAQKDEASKMAWFFLLSSLTLLSAFLLKAWAHVLLRIRFKKWDAKVHVMGELLRDSPLDDLLFKLSLQKNKYVMLSMDDRKVYVGKVINLGEPSETSGMDQEISIMLLMSGYRDKDRLTVKFTTQYEEVDTDIYLTLRQDAIASATEFNFDAYTRWNPAKDEKRSRRLLYQPKWSK